VKEWMYELLILVVVAVVVMSDFWVEMIIRAGKMFFEGGG